MIKESPIGHGDLLSVAGLVYFTRASDIMMNTINLIHPQGRKRCVLNAQALMG